LPVLLPVAAVLALVQADLGAVPVGARLDPVLDVQVGADPLARSLLLGKLSAQFIGVLGGSG